MPEVEALCDRAIIIMNGRIRADARLSELATTSDAILVLQDEVKGVESALREMSGVRGVEPIEVLDGYPAFRVLGAERVDLCPTVYDVARQNAWPLRELRRDARTLETVFNQLATTAFEDEDEASVFSMKPAVASTWSSEAMPGPFQRPTTSPPTRAGSIHS